MSATIPINNTSMKEIEPSGWKCEFFGMGENGLVIFPVKGAVPNRFWRWMQFICFGNRWRKVQS